MIKTIAPILMMLACFGLSPTAQAVVPAPAGGYPNQNTAEGDDALFSLTTGGSNTAIGNSALYSNTTGGYNTAIGNSALYSNTTGYYNTATGDGALYSNTTGFFNVANGEGALYFNTTGDNNVANGLQALWSNTTGGYNTANGFQALAFNTTGDNNVANGDKALFHNTTGNNNIAIGINAGINLTTGDNNIDIGNQGVAGEANTIRIGTSGTQTNVYMAGIYQNPIAHGGAVTVDSTGHLGMKGSSARFKEAIKPMGKASEAILALKPVTFRYKKELDPTGAPQFGLIAEEVAKMNPDLVVTDEQGKPFTVRYEEVNAMLLNEFLKEHRKVQELEANAAEQQKEIRALSTSLKEQATQIQKVSAQLELNKPAPRTVANNH